MTINEILAIAEPGKPLQIPASWGQGRTLYGGITGAIMAHAMAGEVNDPERRMTSLSISFTGPVEADRDFTISTDVLRAGRAASHVEARIIQNGTVRAAALGLFSKGMESQITVESFTPPALPGPDDPSAIALNHPLAPRFVQQFDARMVVGQIPFSGSAHGDLGGWVRFAEAPDRMRSAELVGLIDAWPGASIQMLKGPANMSTATWHMLFAQPLPALDPAAYLGYEAKTDHARDGLTVSTARLWTPEGRLVAVSTQSVMVYG